MNEAATLTSDLADSPDIRRAAERLRAGEVCVELRDDNVSARAAALEALLRRVAGSETKLVWIGNPLRSPLTIERLMLQAAGPEADLRVERSPAELAIMLQSAAEGAPRCLMIVQQSETLDPNARDALARIAPLLRDVTPSIQFLFCGTNAFRPIAPFQPALRTPTRLAEPLPPLSKLVYETIPPPRPARERLPILVLLLIAAIGSLIPSPTHDDPAPRGPVEAAAVPPPPVPAVAPAAVAPSPASGSKPPEVRVGTPDFANNAPLAIDNSALRREFDAFLAQQSPPAPALTPNQRDALFDEFLARKHIQNKL